MKPSEIDHVARCACESKRYALIGFVAAGAFKRTYHARLTTGESVAMKVYQPGFSQERTMREIQAMQKCSHPGVASLRDLFTYDVSGQTYMVTLEEFLPDGTLASRLQNGHLLSPEEVAGLARELGAAIAHVASMELVRRDIKPENIMFRGTTPVIVDFGLVRDLGATSLTQTWLASGPGTPFFASPEQLRNEKALIDWRSDQFSLGVTLAICAFGYHPFATSASPAETIERVIQRAGPDPSFEAEARRSGLAPLVKMVDPWPVRRYRFPTDLQVAWQRSEQ